MTLAFILDVVVASLLTVTILYAGMLNRRLVGLRSNRAELELLIQSFNESCSRAELASKLLRSATDEATRLQQYLDRSQTLRDDLSYLLDRGGNLADRLENNVRSARNETKSHPITFADHPIPESRNQPDKSTIVNYEEKARSERDHGTKDDGLSAVGCAVRPARDRSAFRQALPGDGHANSVETPQMASQLPRSKAERDLLQALRAKR